MENNFRPNYIQCPTCRNILNMTFVDQVCPNPICGFNFADLEVYIDKDDDELRKAVVSAHKAKNDQDIKLIATAIRYNIGNYLAHFIECGWGAHYNTLYTTFIQVYLDDLNVLQMVLKSDVIKEEGDFVVSKNGYKMYYELFERLKKLNGVAIRNFLIFEFPEFHKRHYKAYFLKYDADRKAKNKKFAQKDKLI